MGKMERCALRQPRRYVSGSVNFRILRVSFI
jgi:hypothetical protein